MSVHIESSNFMQTTAEEFTQQKNDLHKNNTLFDTGFRGLLSKFEKKRYSLGRQKKKSNFIDFYIIRTAILYNIIII